MPVTTGERFCGSFGRQLQVSLSGCVTLGGTEGGEILLCLVSETKADATCDRTVGPRVNFHCIIIVWRQSFSLEIIILQLFLIENCAFLSTNQGDNLSDLLSLETLFGCKQCILITTG